MKKSNRSNSRSGGRKRSPLLFGITFRAILIVAAAAMFLSYTAVYVNPSKFSLPLFFGLYFIPILGINIFLLLLALLRRSASAWITVIALLPALLYTELFFKIGSGEDASAEGIELKIESWNVGMFSSATAENGSGEIKLSREECRKEVALHIKEEDPHIVCLQEFFVENRTQADTIFRQYPHRHYHLFKARNGKLFGNIILSKFPLKETGRISFPNSTNLSIFADIEHYGRTLRVYNNHLESYNVSFTALAQKFAELVKKNERHSLPSTEEERSAAIAELEAAKDEITRDIVTTHEKMKGTFIKRSQQVESIIGHINSTPHQAIICGDFNDTPMSYTYHTLSKNRKDTFEEAGRGFGATFAPIWPLLRIDYLLVPATTQCLNHTTHKITLSDHYPSSATVII